MQSRATVLIIDDDPTHLTIYSWIIEAAGYRALPVELKYAGLNLPDDDADVVLLDYNFTGPTTAVDVANLIRQRHRDVPIIVLSDRWELPEDVAPLVQGFVRKGEPAKLVATLQDFLRPSP